MTCSHTIWEHAAQLLERDRRRMPSELTLRRYEGADVRSPRHAFLADLYRRALHESKARRIDTDRSSSGE